MSKNIDDFSDIPENALELKFEKPNLIRYQIEDCEIVILDRMPYPVATSAWFLYQNALYGKETSREEYDKCLKTILKGIVVKPKLSDKFLNQPDLSSEWAKLAMKYMTMIATDRRTIVEDEEDSDNEINI
jgi:hypothetical protein